MEGCQHVPHAELHESSCCVAARHGAGGPHRAGVRGRRQIHSLGLDAVLACSSDGRLQKLSWGSDECQQRCSAACGRRECQADPAGSQVGYMALCSHTSSGLLAKRRCRVLAASCSTDSGVSTPTLPLIWERAWLPQALPRLRPGCNAASASLQPHGSAEPSGASQQTLEKRALAYCMPCLYLQQKRARAFEAPEVERARCPRHGTGACLDEGCATAQHVQGVVLLVGQGGGGHVVGQLVGAGLDIGEVLQPGDPRSASFEQPCCYADGQVKQCRRASESVQASTAAATECQ